MRRALRRGALVAGMVLALGATPALGDRLVFTVADRPAVQLGTAHPVAPVPPGFVGVSMDYCAISRYTGAHADPVLARLLLNVAPTGPVIRVGGHLGQPCPSSPAPLSPAPRAIAALARATAASLILGIGLGPDPGRVRSDVRTLVNAIAPAPERPSATIQAFELGNEPDLFRQYGAYGPPAQIEPNFLRYLHDFDATASTVRQAVGDPRVGIAGPSLSAPTSPWISGPHAGNFPLFLNGPSRPDPVTFHAYPLHGVATCPGKLCPSLANLLGERAGHGLALALAPFVRVAGAKRPVRVDEMNSVAQGGVADVSNTFATALWALDALFEYLQSGVEGVNFHTFNNAAYQLYSGPRPGGWLVFPEYFGLLTFARAAPAGSQLLAVSPARGAAPAVHVWATRARAGRTAIVVINESLSSHQILLQGPGVPVKSSARVARLLAPASPPTSHCPPAYAATGLCATADVTLGGAGFGPSGTGIFGGEWTRTGRLRPVPGGVCSSLPRCTRQPAGRAIELIVPAGSATVLFSSAHPPRTAQAPRGAKR